MKERNNILDKLKRPWIWNGWMLKYSSDNPKRDREIVMDAVKLDGQAIQFASEDLHRDI